MGWADPLEKGKGTLSSILAWRIYGLCSPRSHKEPDMTEQLSLAVIIIYFKIYIYSFF